MLPGCARKGPVIRWMNLGSVVQRNDHLAPNRPLVGGLFGGGLVYNYSNSGIPKLRRSRFVLWHLAQGKIAPRGGAETDAMGGASIGAERDGTFVQRRVVVDERLKLFGHSM